MILQDTGFSDSAGTPESMATMMSTDWNVSVLQPSGSIEEIAFSPMRDVVYPPPDQQLQFICNINATFDPPMSFRDRHRLLDGIYNSYSDPDLISARILDSISQRVGLSMEEVLSWFEDEKERRRKLLSKNFNSSRHAFPPSPVRTVTPGSSSTATLCLSQYASPGATSHMDEWVSPTPIGLGEWSNGSEELTISRTAAPVRAKRGRPAKNRWMFQDPSLHNSKRMKSSKYPCPDCNNILAAERWSEHVKRVHFPDQVWECPKVNQRTRKPCCSKPFFRPDNFATHLRGEHACGVEEISQLKEACKFRTKSLFHQLCGFCNETFQTRDDSIEHIKDHFREISERDTPPADFGASEWKEKCKSDHKLKRGVHYHVNNGASHNNSDQDEDYDDGNPGGSGGSGQGNSDAQPHGNSQNQQEGDLTGNGSGGFGDSSGFCGSQDSNYMDYQQYPTTAESTSQKSSTDLPYPNPSIVRFGEVLLPSSPDDQFVPGGGIFMGSGYAPFSLPRNLGLSSHSSYAYPPPHMSGPASCRSHSHRRDLAEAESREKGRCTYPECGKVFKDLKAHMLTHQNERPEKCPIQTCDYHVKGFSRKYDKHRHTLTHYKGTMVCSFCPGSGSPAAKLFNRADVFKRHLTSVHYVERTPLDGRKASTSVKRRPVSSPDATGNCSTCSLNFSSAQEFYEHLDDCVLKIVQLEEPSEAVMARQLAEVEQNRAVRESDQEDVEEEVDDENDGDFSLRPNSSPKRKSKCHKPSQGGVTLNSKFDKKPADWQMKMKKRVLSVFDGPRRLWKDDMMLDTDCEVRLKLGDERSYIRDVNVEMIRQADGFHNATEEEKGPWIADNLNCTDLEKLMEVRPEL